MALLEEIPKYKLKTLVMIGIPAFLIAVVISAGSHQFVHFLVDKIATRSQEVVGSASVKINLHGMTSDSPVAAAAGPIWTFMLALVSFWFYLHNPKNLFAASMAFVNASCRLPDTITVFLQLLLHSKTTMLTDESFSLTLLKLDDPTISIVLLCFFSLTLFFLTIIIIHDTKMVPWKWLVALLLFISMITMENIIWKVISLMIN